MVDIPSAITALTGFLSMVKTIRDTERAYDKAELQSQMVDLYVGLADVKMALSDAQLEIREREEHIREMQDKAKFKSTLIIIDGYKYDQIDGRPVGLPYCPQCETAEDKMFRLIKSGSQGSRCSNCKNRFPVVADGKVHPKKTGYYINSPF